MTQTVDLTVFYPYPPERVWQVLTDCRSLAAWMMENDFEAKLGHKFQFYSQPLPGLKTTIQCEVVELEAPTRLVYTWRESLTAEPALVVWTLSTVEGGTQLHLKHYQYRYTPAVAMGDQSAPTCAQCYSTREGTRSGFGSRAAGQHPEAIVSPAGWTMRRSRLSTQEPSSQYYPAEVTILDLLAEVAFTWDDCLLQTLPTVLAQGLAPVDLAYS